MSSLILLLGIQRLTELSHFGMFLLFLREEVHATLASYVLVCIRLTIFQLYIGEACWAFLFGVIIGRHTSLVWATEYPENRSIWSKYPRLGRCLSGNNGHDHTWAYTGHSGHQHVCYQCGVAESVHGTALEEFGHAFSSHDMGQLLLLLSRYISWLMCYLLQGWFVSATPIFALILGLNFLLSLAVAASVCLRVKG